MPKKENKVDQKEMAEEWDHLSGVHPAWMHTMLFIGVLSFSLTVLITLFSVIGR